jgi:hypothetical protein
VIGAFVRGLSMRDVESLCEKARLGKLSKSTASRVCEELRERYEAFKRPHTHTGLSPAPTTNHHHPHLDIPPTFIERQSETTGGPAGTSSGGRRSEIGGRSRSRDARCSSQAASAEGRLRRPLVARRSSPMRRPMRCHALVSLVCAGVRTQHRIPSSTPTSRCRSRSSPRLALRDRTQAAKLSARQTLPNPSRPRRARLWKGRRPLVTRPLVTRLRGART